MAKSLIYVANPGTQALVVGNTVGLGSTIRRFGCNISQAGDTITLNGAGYYRVSGSFTFTPTAAGTATVTLFDGSVPVVGATSSETVGAAAVTHTMSIEAVVRVRCNCADNSLRFVLSGADGAMSNVAVVVEKV